MDIINYDNIISKYIPQKQYINPSVFHFKHPCNAIISGKSGMGKTNLLLNLIERFTCFHVIYLYTSCLCEDKYQYLIKKQQEKEEIMKKKHNIDIQLIHFSENIDDIVDLNDINQDYQNLIIIDDLVLEKNQDKIKNLFMKCRKYNTSTIYLTQDFFKIPIFIRKNAKMVILFKNDDNREVRQLYNIYCRSDMEFGKFNHWFKEATKNNGVFVIDLSTDNIKYKFRCNFVYLFN